MNELFLLKKIIANLLLPPTSLVLVGGTGLLLLNRAPRVARLLLWFAVIFLLLLSLPVVERGLMRGLAIPPPTERQIKAAQAIVILGGGVMHAAHREGDVLSKYSLGRVYRGAVLAKRLGLPVLVTGGQVYGGRPEAEVMAEVLRRDFAVDVQWVENRARDTADNLAFGAALLKTGGIDTVLLVTDDFHMRRALGACRLQALRCTGVSVPTYSITSDSWIEELPAASTFQESCLALREQLGLLAQRLRH